MSDSIITNIVQDNDIPGAGDGNKTAKRLNRTQFAGVGGMKLGKYPFLAAVKYYLNTRYGIIAESTYKEEERKLKYLAGVFEGLKEDGLIVSTDPRHIKEHDIQEFLAWMRKKALDPQTQAKYFQHLKNLLRCYKNHVILDMEAQGVRFPKNTKKAIRTIHVDDLITIFETLDSMEGWDGSVSRGMCALAFTTGIRPKEFRLAQVEDLDLNRMRFFVRHPKGEGSWASQEWVDIIRPEMRPLLVRYLKEREIHVMGKNRARATYLFPNMNGDNDTFYSENHINKVKAKIEKLSGVDFRMKDFRPTLTTITCDSDISLLPAMSVQLRHTDIKTTQKSYYAMDRGRAGSKLKDAWKNTPSIIHDTPVIKNNFDFTGYN